jgi:hypothetical protein
MNDSPKSNKIDFKTKKKYNYNHIDEENLSFREVKREKMQKHYRNYENALRSKNLDRLLSYEDDE